MEKTLLRFVWRHSWRDQLVLILASFASFPLILSTLYIPKIIVNDAIRGESFPQPWFGFSLAQTDFLTVLCVTLLALILANNGIKYFINVSKGLTGERILRRLRYTIFSRVIRFPLPKLRTTSPSEVVQIMVAEVEPLGGFSGEVIATPVYLGGQLIVFVGFIIAQDPFLGLAAIILFPVQALVVPQVQRMVIRLVQQRIRNTREMTAEISESIIGIETMRINSAEAWHLARMSERLYTNFRIRYRIFFLKFAIKFANNIVNHITPFFFYSFGGYLVIEGRMDLGALVAILAAYKDIAAPWRDLLTFYQTYSDISARYESVYATIGQAPVEETGPRVHLRGQAVRFDGVSTDTGPDLGGVQGVSLTLPPGSRVAVIGSEEGGRTSLLRLLAGLALPAQGSIIVGQEQGRDLLVRACIDLAHVSRQPHIQSGTFRENLSYSLLAAQGRGDPPEDAARRLREARITGASPEDPAADWVDYARIGLPNPEAFDAYVLNILEVVGLQKDLFARGLSTRLDPARTPHLVEAALRAREMVEAEEAEGAALASMIERWDPAAYLENASLAENLFFGVPDRPGADIGDLAARPDLRRALRQAGVEDEVLAIGCEAGDALAELLASVGKNTTLIDQIGLIRQSEREEVTRIASLARRRGPKRLSASDRMQLLRLAFRIVPLRHRLGTLDDPDRRARIVAARGRLRSLIAAEGWFHHFDDPGYLPGLPLIENILGGRPRLDRRDVQPSIEVRLERIMSGHGMYDFVTATGLRTDVGVAGNALSPLQRRKLGIGRALTEKPALLLLDGIADEPGAEAAALRAAIAAMLPGATLVWGTGNEALASEVDLVIRVAEGRAVVEPGGAR